MSVHGAVPRKLFDAELPDRVTEALRIVEARAKQPITALRGEQADVAPVVGFFDDGGRPFLACAEERGTPPLEAIAIEVARLVLREGRLEKNMPYAEMRHPVNQRLCQRLYRTIEAEILLPECEARGVSVRRYVAERASRTLLEPLAEGSYRSSEPDPGRLREGALDALEAAIAEVSDKEARRIGQDIAKADAGIARAFGLMYKVVEQHRPFEGQDRIRAAYYLAVPFLFDARKPATPWKAGPR